MILMFGLAFELPVVVMPFVKLGVLTYDMMKSTRRYAIVAIAVLAAVITPTPDVATMMLMAVPMYALYEICIIWPGCMNARRPRAPGRKSPGLKKISTTIILPTTSKYIQPTPIS